MKRRSFLKGLLGGIVGTTVAAPVVKAAVKVPVASEVAPAIPDWRVGHVVTVTTPTGPDSWMSGPFKENLRKDSAERALGVMGRYNKPRTQIAEMFQRMGEQEAVIKKGFLKPVRRTRWLIVSSGRERQDEMLRQVSGKSAEIDAVYFPEAFWEPLTSRWIVYTLPDGTAVDATVDFVNLEDRGWRRKIIQAEVTGAIVDDEVPIDVVDDGVPWRIRRLVECRCGRYPSHISSGVDPAWYGIIGEGDNEPS